jgi:hypothetical protein
MEYGRRWIGCPHTFGIGLSRIDDPFPIGLANDK